MAKKICLCCVWLILMIVSSTTALTATFKTNHLTGTWYGHQVVSGDAPADHPRWGYGTMVVDSAGDYTATWNSPTVTNEVSTGTLQINGDGIVGMDNDPLIHGVMNDEKDQIVFSGDLLLRQCLNLKIHYTTGSELIVINH
jgi:hypothetical protein